MLSDSLRLTKAHYNILFMSWAGWLFDFYDLILYSFLLIPIGKELGFSKMEHSLVLGTSLAMTAVGGVLFGYLSDKFGRKRILQWTILTYSILELFSGEIRRTFLLALMLTTFDMCAYWFTYTWLPSYLHEDRGFSMVRSGLFILTTQLGGFLGYVTFGHVADRLGRRPGAYTILPAEYRSRPFSQF